MTTPPSVSVLTASYNRAHLLPRLFASLQAANVAEWIIVDDGSQDDTAAVVQGFEAQAGFTVHYHRVVHGGKHRALNAGLDLVQTSWVVIIDSDDWLLDNGWTQILSAAGTAEKGGAEAAFLPVIVPRAARQHTFRLPGRHISYRQMLAEEPAFDCTILLGPKLRKSRFPEYPNEGFLAEGMFFLTAQPAPVVYLAHVEAIGVEYQPDGISANSLSQRMGASLGSTHLYQKLLALNLPIGLHLRALVNFGRFWWHGLIRGKPAVAPRSASQVLALCLCWPLTASDYLRLRKTHPSDRDNKRQ